MNISLFVHGLHSFVHAAFLADPPSSSSVLRACSPPLISYFLPCFMHVRLGLDHQLLWCVSSFRPHAVFPPFLPVSNPPRSTPLIQMDLGRHPRSLCLDPAVSSPCRLPELARSSLSCCRTVPTVFLILTYISSPSPFVQLPPRPVIHLLTFATLTYRFSTTTGRQ